MKKNAPVTKAASLTCKVGDNIVVPITTNGFSDVVAITLSLRYNPAYLEYQGTVVANKFKVPDVWGWGMLTNDYLMNGPEGFRCIACVRSISGINGFSLDDGDEVMYHVFKTKKAGTANLVWINKSIKNPQTTCEWGAVSSENGQITDLYAMIEDDNTYVNGTITIQ